MLYELSIHQLGPIADAVLTFRNGLTFLSGESGVGKSVMVRSLKLLTGGKGDATYVRRGADRAQVSGRFLVPEDHSAMEVLRDLGLFEGRAQTDLLLRRQIMSSGRSQAWINDTPVTIGALQSLGRKLLTIVSQHEYSRILEESAHLQYLDSFLPDKAVLSNFQRNYSESMDLWKKLVSKLSVLQEKQKFIPLWEYERAELEALNPKSGEYAELLNQVKSLSIEIESKKILREIANDLSLCGDQGEPWTRIKRNLLALKKNNQAYYEQLSQNFEIVLSKLRDVAYSTETLAQDDKGYEEIEFCENRLAQYQKLVRKFSLVHGDLVKQELDKILIALDEAKNQQGALDDTAKAFCKSCEKLFESKSLLSEARGRAKLFLEKEIHKILIQLKLENAIFEVNLLPVEPNSKTRANDVLEILDGFLVPKLSQELKAQITLLASIQEDGAEKARFLFGASQGDPLCPLVKVASGGEASRLTLAIQSALAEGLEPHTIVLDEVDTGVSGEVADRVGLLIHKLSKKFQIIGISHLPQVLAYGHHHYLIEKTETGERVSTKAKLLNAEELDRELARLLSGAKVTNASLEQAKQLRKNLVLIV